MHFGIQELPQRRVGVAGVGEGDGRRVSDERLALDRNRGPRQVKFSNEVIYVLRLATKRLLQPAGVDLAVLVQQSVDDTTELVEELLGAVELVVGALQRQLRTRVAAVEHQADRTGQLCIRGSLILDPLDVVT